MNHSWLPSNTHSISGIPNIPSLKPNTDGLAAQPANYSNAPTASPASVNGTKRNIFNTNPITPQQPQSVVPYQAPETHFAPVQSLSPVTAAATETKKSGFNFGDIKGFIDRMGGVDGIVSTMTKVQKVMQSVQQFAPVAKLLFSTFGSSKAKSSSDDEDLFFTPTKPRKRRKRTKKTTGNPGGNSPKSRTKRQSAKAAPRPQQSRPKTR